MKRKCRPKGLAQNPGNARQIIVHFMIILRQTGAAQFMGPEPRASSKRVWFMIGQRVVVLNQIAQPGFQNMGINLGR